jgi:ubiquinone/menaquinone biosynthesis C-methylase UbiE
MTKPRIPETDHGIQGADTVAMYDQMQRHLRDRGWIATRGLIESGVTQGHALEIGYGPGYLGLEWLKQTQGTRLSGLDISPDMQALAERNARQYGLSERTHYCLGSCDQLPFQAATFDAVFSNGSLHEWVNPCGAFDEIWRVLKPGGCYFVSDLRRDMRFVTRAFLWWGTQPASARHGLLTSIGAAYTPEELGELLRRTTLQAAKVTPNPIDLEISGVKVSGE